MTTRRTAHTDLDLIRLLTLVERRITDRISAALATAGGNLEEWRVLSLLADGNGHSMTEIADFALLPPPTLTKVVDRLVTADLVYRRVDQADRRRVLVFLSAGGRASDRRMAAAIEQHDLAAAAGREELALLAALLTHIAERLA